MLGYSADLVSRRTQLVVALAETVTNSSSLGVEVLRSVLVLFVNFRTSSSPACAGLVGMQGIFRLFFSASRATWLVLGGELTRDGLASLREVTFADSLGL